MVGTVGAATTGSRKSITDAAIDVARDPEKYYRQLDDLEKRTAAAREAEAANARKALELEQRKSAIDAAAADLAGRESLLAAARRALDGERILVERARSQHADAVEAHKATVTAKNAAMVEERAALDDRKAELDVRFGNYTQLRADMAVYETDIERRRKIVEMREDAIGELALKLKA